MSNKEYYLKFIIENRNKLTNKEMAIKLNISNKYVSTLKRENGINQKIEYQINDIQNQIIMSGLLGDGNLKANGRYNYYYRECHSVKESEYLKWKFDTLSPLTDGCSINKHKQRTSTCNPQESFNTKTLKELIPYSKMTYSDFILGLNDLGLILYILDDGWKHRHSKVNDKYNVNLAVNKLNSEEKLLLINQFINIMGIDCKVICADKNTISFNMKYNEIFINTINKYGLQNLDVVRKKF